MYFKYPEWIEVTDDDCIIRVASFTPNFHFFKLCLSPLYTRQKYELLGMIRKFKNINLDVLLYGLPDLNIDTDIEILTNILHYFKDTRRFKWCYNLYYFDIFPLLFSFLKTHLLSKQMYILAIGMHVGNMHRITEIYWYCVNMF